MIFYAHLESIEYFQHLTRSKIRKVLWSLSPLSAPLIIIYQLIHSLTMKRNPYINVCTVTRAIYPYPFYEILVHTLMNFRGEKREKMSKLISRYGLIKLLNLDK